MKEIRCLVGILLLCGAFLGCASFGPSEADDRPVLQRTLFGPAGEIIGTVEVSFTGGLYGRGCQALTISPDGGIDYLMQQDASSDYSTVRGLVATVPETVAVMLNPISSLLNALVVSLGGALPMSGPSEIHGCEGLFVVEPEASHDPADVVAPDPD
jgi:hypothetical protein